MKYKSIERDFVLDGGLLKMYRGKDRFIIIPKGVTEIGSSAFKNNVKIIGVKLPDDIIKIDNNAFYGCKKLKIINMPNCLTDMGNAVFRECKNLKTIKIPDSVEKIGDSAFRGCDKLENVALPEKLTVLNEASFLGCKRLKKISIPSRVEMLGKRVFADCTALENVDFSLEIKKIGREAFLNCKKLKTIVLPDKLFYIGACAFDGCFSLKNIRIPSSIEVVEEGAFGGVYLNEKMYKGKKYVYTYCYSSIMNRRCSLMGKRIRLMNDKGVFYLGNAENPYLVVMKVAKRKDFVDLNPNTKVIAGGADLRFVSNLRIPKNCRFINPYAIPSEGEGRRDIVGVVFDEPVGWKYNNNEIATEILKDAVQAAKLLCKHRGGFIRNK